VVNLDGWLRIAIAPAVVALGCSALGCADSFLLVPPADATRIGFQPGTAAPGPEAQSRGLEGELSQAELEKLFWLQWPQSAVTMRKEFGIPNKEEPTADYYQIQGTQAWVKVIYARQGEAIGFQIGH
jgi:hypothetical protein